MIYKYKDIEDLKKKIKDKHVSFTCGCFDLLHRGHVEMIKDAKGNSDILVVGIMPDSYIEKRKGCNRPIQNQKNRAILVDSLKHVDCVLLLVSEVIEGKLPVGAVIDLKPTVYVSRSTQWKKYIRDLNKNKVKLKILDTKKIDSTSKIISKIIKLNCE